MNNDAQVLLSLLANTDKHYKQHYKIKFYHFSGRTQHLTNGKHL